jgi:hypothetical protein
MVAALRASGETPAAFAPGVAVAGNEIFVADQGGTAINVIPLSATGDVRRIAGPLTKLLFPSSVLVRGEELYVAQESGTVLVFPLSASGDVAPTRTITGLGQAQYIAIDGDEMYVSDSSVA